MIVWLAATALAQELAARTPTPILGHPVLEVRAGVSADAAGVGPSLCAGVTPLPWLSVEGCGSGGGFLYPANGPDLAHIRARARLAHARRGALELEGSLGAGVAEAEWAEDAPGFIFGRQGGAPVETAGPEITASASFRAWVDPRVFVVVDLTGGSAWLAEAPAVLGTEGEIVPFVALSAGAGF